jgi:hypothetical protein
MTTTVGLALVGAAAVLFALAALDRVQPRVHVRGHRAYVPEYRPGSPSWRRAHRLPAAPRVVDDRPTRAALPAVAVDPLPAPEPHHDADTFAPLAEVGTQPVQEELAEPTPRERAERDKIEVAALFARFDAALEEAFDRFYDATAGVYETTARWERELPATSYPWLWRVNTDTAEYPMVGVDITERTVALALLTS